MRKVSIVIPVVRPEGARRCIKAIEGSHPNNDQEIIFERDTDRVGCPIMVKRLVEKSQHDLVMFLGDDTIPQPGFIDEAVATMETLPDGWGLVALNDGIHNGALATHWLADKRLLPYLGGEFFHTGYHHCFCDRELTDIAKEMERYAYAQRAVIVHDHPHVTREPYDEHYRRAYEIDTFNEDQRLYWRRKISRTGFKIGIALPLVDKDIPAQAALSLMVMDKPSSWTLLVPKFPPGQFCESIASVRNDLVEQALEQGCSHLLMADTDQVYPRDTLRRLLSHGERIVGVAVHRRWPPFDRILMRGTPGCYSNIPNDEAYSGNLIEVDATGTGCLLFDTTVFLDIKRPWFSFGHTEDGRQIGEDISFCAKARAAGISIHVDTGLEVEHLTTFRINGNFARLFNCINNKSLTSDSGSSSRG